MATLEITETEDFRARAVTAFGGIDRIEFDNTPNLSATFSSNQFGDLSLLFSGISNDVTIQGADLIGFTSTMTVFLSGSTVFSAAGWTLLTPLNVNIIGASTSDTLTGSATGDFIRGNAGNDTLNGGGGGDTLNGGAGADNLNGGSGSDTASYADALAGGGGLGITVVMLNMSLNSGEAFGDVYNSIENITGTAFKDFIAGNASANKLSGLAGDDTLLGQGGNDTLEGGEGNDTLNGQSDADTLKGGIGDDELFGGDGSDSLLGEAGNDTLNGGLGADSLNGADGIDVASYGNASLGVNVFMLNTSLNTGEAAGDTYSQIENIVGSNSADTLAGNDVANTILGGNSADTIIGNGGTDILNGEAGDDILIGGLGADVLNGGAGASGGRDTASYVNATAGLLVSLASPELNGGEAAGDSYISIENLAGSGFDDILGGNANANTLSGGNGGDILVGEGGDDTLRGEAGNDNLTGGAGADDLVGGDGNDRFRFLSGGEVIAGETIDGGTSSGGFDGLALENTGTINFTVAEISGVEILDFVNGTSVATFRSTQIRSNAIALISGNLIGADTLIVGGTNISLSGVSFFDWSLDDTISLVGTAGADTIAGSVENDAFTGGLGNDILVGGNGSDTANYADQSASIFTALADSASSQVFVGGVAQDTIAGIENIIGGGLGDVLFGNSEGNSFFGNAGDDLLRGGAGLDTLDGGAGLGDTADYSDKSIGAISVTLRGANEAQVLLDGTAEDMILNIENLIGGLGADTLIGDARKNELSGNAGNDTLEGKNGRDTLNGAAGEDVLRGGASRDTLTGGGDSDRFDFDIITDTGTTNSTRDVITDFVHGEDKIDLSGIDANSVGGGANDTFSFITSGSFTSPGQIIVVTSGATNAIVRINTDGDSDAEATILLRNVDADLISAGDFIL